MAKQKKSLDGYENQVKQLNQQVAIMNEVQTQQITKIKFLEEKLEHSIEAQHKADKQTLSPYD